MGKLYGSLAVLVLVFSTAMSFVTLGVYDLTWWWSVIGVAILVVFAALGGLLVPATRKGIGEADRKAANGAMQLFGALLMTEFLTMALVCWCLGNRTLSSNNAYETLGLLIFLGLLGAGAQGVMVTFARWLYYRNETVVARQQAQGAQLAQEPAH
ncbi:MAG TPA: hypothetical protein VHW47_00790 [Acidimicrobiales bacterium]|nr:hypothetical protein [Acidimicrobiales bacterium]